MQQRRPDDRFLWVGLWIIISICCPSSRSASDRNYRTFLKNSMIQAEHSNCEWTRLEFHALMSTSAVTQFFNCLPWFNQFSNCIRQHTLYMYQYVCVCELDVCVFTALMLTFILLMWINLFVINNWKYEVDKSSDLKYYCRNEHYIQVE